MHDAARNEAARSPRPEPYARRTAPRLRVVALAAAALLLGLAGRAAEAPTGASPGRAAVQLGIEGAIGPAMAEYLTHGLAKAAERGAPLVILQVDTPGGLDTSMREIIRAILAAPVPVVAYVSPSGARAASAGTYILYASHVAAMAPGTNLGAATPIAIGGLPVPSDRGAPGKDEEDKDKGGAKRSPMETKAVNDAAAYIRALAELHGRNADWGEKAVREGASLSAEAARDEKVIDLIATSVPDLLEKIDGRAVKLAGKTQRLETKGLAVTRIEPDWRTLLLGAITNPTVALLLMMIGVYGLILEFLHPGALYPGTTGAICLIIALYALNALPVNFAGVGLIVLGLVLMVAEALTPSFGALGMGGIVAFAFGATIMFDTDLPQFEVSRPMIAVLALASLAFMLVVVRLALKARREAVRTGREEMLGAPARVVDWNGTAGHVLAHGERWKATSSATLAAGQQVRIAGIDGLTLAVEPRPAESGKAE